MNDVLRAAAELMAGMPPEERERAKRQMELLAVAQAPPENLTPEIPVRTLREYLEVVIPEPPRLVIPSVLVRGELTAIIGKSGKGKTTLNLHRLLRWAAGLRPFEELDTMTPVKPLKTLLIENEGSAGMFQEKMKVMLADETHLDKDALQIVLDNFLIWGDGGYSGLKINADKDYDLIRRALEATQPDVLFLEPFRQLWRGNENDSEEMAEVIDRMIRLGAEYKVAVLLSHHEKKNREVLDKMDLARGSSALDGAAQLFENFEAVQAGKFRELSWSKSRYDIMPAPIRLSYNDETRWYEFVSEDDLSQTILQYMQQQGDNPTFVVEMAEATGESQKNLNKQLNALEAEGRVRRLQRKFGEGVPWRLVGGATGIAGELDAGPHDVPEDVRGGIKF